MMNKRIGMLDSGLGGISMLNACVIAYPNYDYVFIGDQKNAPYGELSADELYKHVMGMVHILAHKGIEEIIVACNTVCANILDCIKKDNPNIVFHGIIEPTVKSIDKDCKSILVMATNATTNTHLYRRYIKQYYPTMRIFEVASTKLVPLIESNANPFDIRNALYEYLDPYCDQIDSILLGCTHYPLIAENLKEICDVKLFDSNQAILQALPFIHDDNPGSVEIYTSGNVEKTRMQVKQIMGKDYEVFNFVE